MLDPKFPHFVKDLEKLRKIGAIDGNSASNNISKDFIDALTNLMMNNPNSFLDYDITAPIFSCVEQILLNYGIEDKKELERMKIIMTGWIDGMLKDGGYYDLN